MAVADLGQVEQWYKFCAKEEHKQNPQQPAISGNCYAVVDIHDPGLPFLIGKFAVIRISERQVAKFIALLPIPFFNSANLKVDNTVTVALKFLKCDQSACYHLVDLDNSIIQIMKNGFRLTVSTSTGMPWAFETSLNGFAEAYNSLSESPSKNEEKLIDMLLHELKKP